MADNAPPVEESSRLATLSISYDPMTGRVMVSAPQNQALAIWMLEKAKWSIFKQADNSRIASLPLSVDLSKLRSDA